MKNDKIVISDARIESKTTKRGAIKIPVIFSKKDISRNDRGDLDDLADARVHCRITIQKIQIPIKNEDSNQLDLPGTEGTADDKDKEDF